MDFGEPPLGELRRTPLLETIRKGFEQRSEPGFGRYGGYEKGREVPSRGSAGLRSRRARGFSDSFSRTYGE